MLAERQLGLIIATTGLLIGLSSLDFVNATLNNYPNGQASGYFSQYINKRIPFLNKNNLFLTKQVMHSNGIAIAEGDYDGNPVYVTCQTATKLFGQGQATMNVYKQIWKSKDRPLNVNPNDTKSRVPKPEAKYLVAGPLDYGKFNELDCYVTTNKCQHIMEDYLNSNPKAEYAMEVYDNLLNGVHYLNWVGFAYSAYSRNNLCINLDTNGQPMLLIRNIGNVKPWINGGSTTQNGVAVQNTKKQQMRQIYTTLYMLLKAAYPNGSQDRRTFEFNEKQKNMVKFLYDMLRDLSKRFH
ncbi:hypothetical protein BDF22DRAFT_743509 [Syncephalis plumigaleata]|nr:hypothetical protein BDF22DRAFT_743509 [Syncephalis plumigaleata]